MPTTVLIRIEDEDGDWPVQLFAADGREEWLSTPLEGGLIAPMSAERLDGMRSVVVDEDQSSPAFERIGVELYELVTAGRIGGALDRIAADTPDGVRLLLDVRPDALSRLPWELMRRTAHLLASDVVSPFTRVAKSFPGAAELRPVRWPLRVMVVVGSKAGDQRADAEPEIAEVSVAFRRMCGLLDMEILRQPSRDEVRRTYRQLRPHIFHFVGHGDVDAGQGGLVLYDAENDVNLSWTTPEIDMDLAGWQPRLAVLNACRSSGLEGQTGAWRVADAFAALGAPAVIAMQGDIRGDAAAAFAGGLYSALATGSSLDVAVATGRREITDTVPIDHRDFALPTLTVSSPPESVLRMCFGVATKYRRSVESANRKLWSFVDRTEERRWLWRRMDPDPEELERDNDQSHADAIAIVGGSRVGKSELARWCVGTCQLHGGNASYVDLSRDRRLSFLTVLDVIRQELERSSAVHAERNRAAFETWSRTAAPLLNGDGGGPFAPDVIETVFGNFADALRAAAAGRPLLIALDHVDGVQEEHWAFLCKWFLAPVAGQAVSPVRVIVVLSEDQRNGWLDEDVQGLMPPPVELRQFRPSEFSAIAGWYLRYHFDADPKAVDRTVNVLPVTSDWSWSELTGLAELAPSLGWKRSRS